MQRRRERHAPRTTPRPRERPRNATKTRPQRARTGANVGTSTRARKTRHTPRNTRKRTPRRHAPRHVPTTGTGTDNGRAVARCRVLPRTGARNVDNGNAQRNAPRAAIIGNGRTDETSRAHTGNGNTKNAAAVVVADTARTTGRTYFWGRPAGGVPTREQLTPGNIPKLPQIANRNNPEREDASASCGRTKVTEEGYEWKQTVPLRTRMG